MVSYRSPNKKEIIVNEFQNGVSFNSSPTPPPSSAPAPSSTLSTPPPPLTYSHDNLFYAEVVQSGEEWGKVGREDC